VCGRAFGRQHDHQFNRTFASRTTRSDSDSLCEVNTPHPRDAGWEGIEKNKKPKKKKTTKQKEKRKKKEKKTKEKKKKKKGTTTTGFDPVPPKRSP
jgi:hypothetical protein